MGSLCIQDNDTEIYQKPSSLCIYDNDTKMSSFKKILDDRIREVCICSYNNIYSILSSYTDNIRLKNNPIFDLKNIEICSEILISAILIDLTIKDIKPLSSLSKLQYIELNEMGNIRSVKSLRKIQDISIYIIRCYNIKDMSIYIKNKPKDWFNRIKQYHRNRNRYCLLVYNIMYPLI